MVQFSNSKNFSPKSFRELCEKSDLNNTLISVSSSLQQFELDAINGAIKGDFESACDLLEDGCIEFYKLGELKILELRDKAEKELGPDFNIRKFHDAVLANGSIPLSVLEAQIEQFIADEKASIKKGNSNNRL